ncbi:MAG: peptidoglycan DD-metalloendopeptidase family protein [Clostridia bacterium]|nr:peptidoglycan DD-metalloendopeptidase family protein [Clostridia bacterium]
MKKVSKVLLFVAIFALALIIRANKAQAAVYIWPVGGNNANETYKDYDFYGRAYTAPYKNGKSGREYIVNNTIWPNEKYFYASCESHYGMDITGINGHTYAIVSVCDGKVIATSGTRASNPGVNYADRNQRRTSAGMNDGGGYGNYVIIEEPSTGRCFLYGHLKGGSLKVGKGDMVTAGQEIATMGSSGDSGHMHVHFEIRKSKANTIKETKYGYHYLVATNSNTNLDPEQYIGTKPNVYTPFTDGKLVKISKDDAKIYVRYLYSTILGREASDEEAEYWASKYVDTESIYEVTRGILFSEESKNNNGELSNLDFLKKTYEIILYRGSNYTESEMSGHLDKLDRGIWNRNDYLAMLCNCKEFTENKCSAIISDMKSEEEKKAEEQRKAEEEKKKQEEEEAKKKEEEKKKQEEEEAKKEQEKNEEYDNVKLYIRYLYRNVLGRKALDNEIEHWIEQYKQNQDISLITRDIFVNEETESMTSYDFMKKIIEVLYNRENVDKKIIESYANQIEKGEISRADFIVGVCSTTNFKENMYKILIEKQRNYESTRKTIAIASEDKLNQLGDLDGDGYISAADASLCLALYSLEDKTDYAYAIQYADVDGDGEVEYEDALTMLTYHVQIMVQNIDSNTTIEEFVKNR